MPVGYLGLADDIRTEKDINQYFSVQQYFRDKSKGNYEDHD